MGLVQSGSNCSDVSVASRPIRRVRYLMRTFFEVVFGLTKAVMCRALGEKSAGSLDLFSS